MLLIYQKSGTYPLNRSNFKSKPTNFPTNIEEEDADFEECAHNCLCDETDNRIPLSVQDSAISTK